MGYRPIPWPTLTLSNRFYNHLTLKLSKVKGIKGGCDFFIKILTITIHGFYKLKNQVKKDPIWTSIKRRSYQFEQVNLDLSSVIGWSF
jgi:hypothetical protein